MNRLRFAFIAMIGFGLVVSSLFIVENEVQGMREDLSEINRQIHSDREAIHVMQAEWAYLTQPQRIAMLVKQNMPELVPQQSAQYYSAAGMVAELNHLGREAQAAAATTDNQKVVQ